MTHKKNPKMVEAGKKAAKTRAKNSGRSDKGKISKSNKGQVTHKKGHSKKPFGGKVISIEKFVSALQTYSKTRRTKTIPVPRVLQVVYGKVKGIKPSIVAED